MVFSSKSQGEPIFVVFHEGERLIEVKVRIQKQLRFVMWCGYVSERIQTNLGRCSESSNASCGGWRQLEWRKCHTKERMLLLQPQQKGGAEADVGLMLEERRSLRDRGDANEVCYRSDGLHRGWLGRLSEMEEGFIRSGMRS